MSNRKESIDILKAICAFFIVCIHVHFPGVAGEYFITLTRIGVPIFFMITGYFYSCIVARHGEKQQIIKILKLTIIGNAIYILWSLIRTIIQQNIVAFKNTFSIRKLFIFFTFNKSPWGEHLWYLSAILYVLIVVAVADKVNGKKVLYFLTPILLCVDLLFGKYAFVFWGMEFPSYFVRNFMFVGIPYFCIGRAIREGFLGQLRRRTLEILMLIFSLTSLLERFILVSNGLNATRDHYISTTLLALTVFLFYLKISYDNKVFSAIGREYSTWLYIIHPIFITCLEMTADIIGIADIYKYIAPVVVYIATLIFLYLADKIKKNVVRRLERN